MLGKAIDKEYLVGSIFSIETRTDSFSLTDKCANNSLRLLVFTLLTTLFIFKITQNRPSGESHFSLSFSVNSSTLMFFIYKPSFTHSLFSSHNKLDCPVIFQFSLFGMSVQASTLDSSILLS